MRNILLVSGALGSFIVFLAAFQLDSLEMIIGFFGGMMVMFLYALSMSD